MANEIFKGRFGIAGSVALGVIANVQAAEPVRLLCIGNSMTRQGPSEKIGWTNDWGKAAADRHLAAHRARIRLSGHLLRRDTRLRCGC